MDRLTIRTNGATFHVARTGRGAPLPGVGHFANREAPDLAASAIADFFGRIGWAGVRR